MLKWLACLQPQQPEESVLDSLQVRKAVNYTRIFGGMRWQGEAMETHAISVNIHCLPSELLASCFFWYVLTIYETRAEAHGLCLYDPPPSPYAWIVIRHVSRYWRTVALSFPILSSYICITSPECVTDMLHWSSEAPLHIYEGRGPETNARRTARRLALQHLARMISAQFRCAGQILDPIPTESPSSLETRPRTNIKCLRIHTVTTPTNAQHAFTQYDFPHLQDFACRFGSIAPYRRILGRSLRRLYLYQCTPASAPYDLVCMLGEMVSLEELILDNALRDRVQPSDNVPGPAWSGHALLPHLRSLFVLDEDFDRLVPILTRLVYPATASVNFQFFPLIPNTTKTANVFLPHFTGTKQMEHTGLLHAQSLYISRRSPTHLELHFWRDRLSIHELWKRHEARSSACYTFSCSSANEHFIDSLLSLAPLGGVKAALLIEPTVTGLLSWGNVLSALVSVEELGLDYETYNNCEVSSSTTGTLADKIARRRLFPNVQTVHIQERWHRHSALPPTECHPLSGLEYAACALTSRRGCPDKETQTSVPSVFSETLDFHTMLGEDVCLCENVVYVETHLDAVRVA